jgi:carbon-monoxide dehydrogenase large subunit
LIRGLAHYVDDIVLPGTLHVAFVRSYYAHAKINSIDIEAARSAPGVVAVYTGQHVSGKIGPVPCAGALPDLKVPDHRVLATNKVYFVGHPVAAVVAKDRYAARDAVDLIVVDYEELPVVTDVEEAAAGGPVIQAISTPPLRQPIALSNNASFTNVSLQSRWSLAVFWRVTFRAKKN